MGNQCGGNSDTSSGKANAAAFSTSHHPQTSSAPTSMATTSRLMIHPSITQKSQKINTEFG
jgi:hypothetical protein